MAGDLRRTGRVSCKGHRVESEDDLAILGEVVSDPQVESFRFVYVRGREVVVDEVALRAYLNSIRSWA